jgi:hypothetical protein
MRTYNERLTDVHTDHVGKPVRWTWRQRTYQRGHILDRGSPLLSGGGTKKPLAPKTAGSTIG